MNYEEIIKAREWEVKKLNRRRNLTMVLLIIAIPILIFIYYFLETNSYVKPYFFVDLTGEGIITGCILLGILISVAMVPIGIITLFLYEKRINQAVKAIRDLHSEANMFNYGVGDYYEVTKFSEAYISNPKGGRVPRRKVYLWFKNGELHFVPNFINMKNHISIKLNEIIAIDVFDNRFVEETVTKLFVNDPLVMGLALVTGLSKKVERKEYGTPYVVFVTTNGDRYYFESGVREIIINEINSGRILN